MTPLRLYLLGPPRLEQAGQSLAIGRRKGLALLIYLAVTNRAQHRDALATLFWPDAAQRRARGNLRQVLSDLNKVLDGDWLRVDGEQISLARHDKLWLDVARFQTCLELSQRHDHAPDELCSACLPLLREAAALYRANFLEGFTLPNTPEFDDWQFFQVESLRQDLAVVLERLAHADTGQEDYETAISYARRWLNLDPLHEPAHRALMRLYAGSGQQAAALRQYDECARLLDDEFGLSPEPETTTLVEAIKAERLVIAVLKEKEPERSNSARTATSETPPLPPFLEEDEAPEQTSIVFVGRERELSELEASLASARAGQGQMLFVIGGAGRGKTLLAQEFARRVQAEDADLVVVSGYCDAMTGVGDPYLPFRGALAMLTGDVEAKWAGGLISQAHARHLWELMPLTLPALVQHAPDLIGNFIPSAGVQARAATIAPSEAPWFEQLTTLTTAEHSPGLEQQRIFSQYTALLKAIAAQRPLLFIIEDLHWIDTASSGLLFHLSREIGNSPILIVGTYRPEEVALSWRDERHPLASLVSELKRQHGDIWLDLDELVAVEGRQFIEAYLDTQPNKLDVVFREALFRHTGGYALFTVELLRDMQERGALVQDENGSWIAAGAIDWQTLPPKVEGVIEKRIKRLEKEWQAVLTIASVEGEIFTAEAVARVQQLGERELVQQLSRELDKRHRLVTAQMLERVGQQRLSRYRFRHHLFQHYLYHSLDVLERGYLHEAVGNVLERLYEGRTAEVAVQLAWHFEEAGLVSKTINYLQKAGEQAIQISADTEAISHLTRALDLLETLPDTPERTQRELTLQIALGNALVASKGYAAPEVGHTYNRARELSQHIEDIAQRFAVLQGLHRFYLVRGDLQTALDLGTQLLDLAQIAQQPNLLTEAHRVLGTTFWFLGEFAPALEHLEEGLTFYDRHQHRAYILQYGQDPGVVCLAYAGWVLWCLGYPDQALKKSSEAITLARELSHPYSLAYALTYAAWPHQFGQEAQAVRDLTEEAINLSAEQGFPIWVAMGTMLRGWALARQGHPEEGIAQIDQGLTAWRSTGAALGSHYYLSLLAKSYMRSGQLEKALDVLDEALAAVSNSGRFWGAELHRLKGELLLRQGETDVETHFQQAIDLARRQGSKSLELRATLSLARYWQSQGKREEARQMLSNIYNWFSEGFDTVDLKEARVLLEELS